MRQPILPAVLLLTLVTSAPTLAAGDDIHGNVARVVDGDTLVVGAQRIRIDGLHAPELKEPLGPTAREFVRALIAGGTVSCAPTGGRSYDRIVARCYLDDDGRDIAAVLVAAGRGRDCPRFSGGRYAELETASAQAMPLPTYCLRR